MHGDETINTNNLKMDMNVKYFLRLMHNMVKMEWHTPKWERRGI